jgi:alpha-beta hydrolase superfamily lysophospholipase
MRQAQELSFATHDGVELFYRHWPAATPEPRGAILLFHRGHEHSGRMAHLVDELSLPDFSFYAWDARGHGRSPGERGFSPSIATSIRDVQSFVDHIAGTDGVAVEDMAVIAQSVGAVIAAAWAHDYAPRIRAMVLASPAFEVKLYVPFARALLKLKQRLRGNFFVNSYVKPRFLTHDRERIASYKADPLITRAISVNILIGLYEVADRVVADARAIIIPTQLLISGSDWVVRHAPQHRFFVNLGARVKERHVLAGFFHDTLGERDRNTAVEKARRFILAQFDAPATRPSLLDADKASYTRDEADSLASPLSPLSPRGLYWMATRLGLRLGGLMSRGIALGRKTGFDSGSTLDYVYRNRPAGLGTVGRAIDKAYLDSIGWRGIRSRKLNVEELIRLAMAKLEAAGRPVHVMDIAAGHGRYVLEALTQGVKKPASILLRDYSDLNVDAGTKLIAEKGLADIAAFRKGDAFDRKDLATVTPKPTLAIVSGLYELFSDNGMIRASLEGLAEAMEPGSYLVYTNQPWHPQLEMIARALTSHRGGEPWVMRRRSQAEMDELVAAAGFRKLEQRIDEWGIFTVSLAVREGARKTSDEAMGKIGAKTSERASDEASPPGQKVEA